MLLANKVALVTGGSTGIGRAISLALGQAGAAVTINYHHNKAAGEETLEQIARAGGTAQLVQGDVSRLEDIQQLIERTVQTFGRLDIMVNNAGMETRTSLLETSEHQFEQVMSVNLKGAFFGTQYAAKQMIAQGSGGRIINISSINEAWPAPGNTAYCCAKGGIRMLTSTAGVELAPHGIMVIGVGPGAVATSMNASMRADPERQTALLSAIPLGRVGEAAEVASLVTWLASDQSSYVTATTFFIDGGMMQARSVL